MDILMTGKVKKLKKVKCNNDENKKLLIQLHFIFEPEGITHLRSKQGEA